MAFFALLLIPTGAAAFAYYQVAEGETVQSQGTHFTAYPGYDGDVDIQGIAAVEDFGTGVRLFGSFSQSEYLVEAPIAIHEGSSCDSAETIGEHYAGDDGTLSDPWVGTTYESDSVGYSYFNLTADGLSLYGDNAVANRVVVVASSDGTNVACGVLSDAIYAEMGTFEGISLSEAAALEEVDASGIFGYVYVSDELDPGIDMLGTIVGGTPGAVGRVYIDASYDCDALAGTFFEGLTEDPWVDTTFTFDAGGNNTYINFTLANFSLEEDFDVANRAVVIEVAGAVAACGELRVASGTSIIWELDESSPAYDPTTPDMGITIRGAFRGAYPLLEGQFHVHEGLSCDDHRGHYVSPLEEGEDPWLVTGFNSSTEFGMAYVDHDVVEFSIDGDNPTEGHAVLFHRADTGSQAACGVFNEYRA